MKLITIPRIVRAIEAVAADLAKDPTMLTQSGELYGIAEALTKAYCEIGWADCLIKTIRSMIDEAKICNRETKKREKEKVPPHPPIENKGKEEERQHSPSACAREGKAQKLITAHQVFDDFWNRYPKGHKVAKKRCFQKFKQVFDASVDEAKFINEFLGGLDVWLKSKRWTDGFICDTTTYLNQRRWEDKPEPNMASAQDNQEAEAKKRSDDLAARLKEIGV